MVRTCRPTIIWNPCDGLIGVQVARSWSEFLALPSNGVCLWVSHANAGALSQNEKAGFCYHEFELDPQLDRYERSINAGYRWSPWGSKSGPNLQFLSVVQSAIQAHRNEVMILLEPDTFPLFDSSYLHSIASTRADSSPWIVGGPLHPSARNSLAPMLHEHINGHAIYRLSPDFGEFLEFVWMPSLLFAIRRQPDFAFDCLHPTQVQEMLPRGLSEQWARHSSHFTVTSRIVNASILHIATPKDLRDLLVTHLEDPVSNSEGVETRDLLSLHVKATEVSGLDLVRDLYTTIDSHLQAHW